MARLFERMAIAGVGLIGGSLAAAAKAAGLVGEVVGFGRTRENLELAQRRGLIDRFCLDPAEGARGADLLVLAVPVQSFAAIVAAAAPSMADGGIVTDAGSVKASVVRDVESVLPAGLSFVGAHPIAGSEATGAGAADSNLFRGHECILTPSARSTPEATAKVRALWQGVGMSVTEMDAARHDQVLAWVSHLPHAISFALVRALTRCDASYADHAGPSFRDLTRIAASSPEMWRDIFVTNRAALDNAIDAFATALDELRATLASGDERRIEEWLRQARDAKQSWSESE